MSNWVEVLLRWFRQNVRRFPWREYRDWYRVLVAEVMLVRTRSEAVEKIYKLFLEAFPQPGKLCRASDQEVEVFFRRLGLIQRAKRLRLAVCAVLDRYRGVLPCSYEELVSLPGIGRYIANVLLTRVCRMARPFVDANIIRFASRFLGVQNIDIDYVEKWLLDSVEEDLLEDVNTALLDLSGLVCVAKKPRCSICPLNTLCRYRSQQPC